MTSQEIQKRAAKRRRYFVLLVLVLILLIFAIVKIVSRPKEPQPVAVIETTPTESELAMSGDVTEGLTRPTHPDPNAPTQPPTIAVTEPEPAPIETSTRNSAGGKLYTPRYHIYVRVNHEQKIPLTVSGGITAKDVVWTSSNPNILDVQPGGVITGLEQGACIVTASVEGDKLEIPVTVRQLNVVNGCTYVDDILVANKSYSLPADYDPGMLPETKAAFESLCKYAAKEGLDIYEGSGYRDYYDQVMAYESMVSGYSKEYADAFSARPGHSEHQTGYTVDCNTINNEDFADTPEGRWLAAHCYEFGFIIRYPQGKEDITGYSYESWHIRYVGREHATAITQQKLTLEEYLDIDSRYDSEEEKNETAPQDPREDDEDTEDEDTENHDGSDEEDE